jgi:hypothetical protein
MLENTEEAIKKRTIQRTLRPTCISFFFKHFTFIVSLSEKSLKLRWKKESADPIFIKDGVELPQFYINGHNNTDDSRVRRDSGKF